MDGSENVLIVPDAMLKKWKGGVIKIPETKSPGSVLSGMGGYIIKGSGQKCQVKESGDEEDESDAGERHFLHVVEDTVKANKDRPFASWYDKKGSLATYDTARFDGVEGL
jgi:hypothetical protein